MRYPEFEASLAEARLRPELWRLVLGILLVVFIYTATAVLILVAAVLVVAAQEGPFAILPFVNSLALPDTQGKAALLLATFAGMFLGPILAAAALHFRGPGTLFGEFDDWLRGFGVAICVVAVVYTPMLVLSWWLEAPLPNVPFTDWLRWLPLVLPLLFLQIGAEELLFRGYLQQQLAARFQARWVWMWLPSALFAALHWSPDAGANLPLVLLAALTFGLVAADLTAATGSLGAAMGLHFANNFVGLLISAMADTITGLSLYITRDPIGAIGMQSLSMASSICLLILVWWVTKQILARF